MKNYSLEINPILAACADAKKAAAATVSAHRDLALSLLAEAISSGAKMLLAANEQDVGYARSQGASDYELDRIRLDYLAIGTVCGRIRTMASTPSPTDEVENRVSEGGLAVRRVRVPLGLVLTIGGLDPRKTIESAAQCIKTGNVMLLVRSPWTRNTDIVFEELLKNALSCCALPADIFRGADYTPASTDSFLSRSDVIDALLLLASPEQNEQLRKQSGIPAIYTDTGVTHIYIDEGADAQSAAQGVIDSFGQLQGPELSCVLVNWKASDEFLPALEGKAMAAGIEIVGDARVRSTLHGIEEARDKTGRANDGRLLVLTVNSLTEAVYHITTHGDGLCEGIYTRSADSARAFSTLVDAGSIAINAPFSRINGYDTGMGGDVGNCSQKLRHRGPVGLSRLTTTKYIIKGK